MFKRLRTYILNFLSDSKQIPWLVGLSAGIYPFFKYYNSNFPLVDSKSHFVVLVLLFLLLPIFGSYFIKIIGAKLHVIKKHEALLFTLNNFVFFALFVIISTWGIRKEYLLIGLVIATIFGFLLKKHLKKAIVFQLLMAFLVVPKLILVLYSHFLTKDNWKNLPDNIGNVKLIEKPNIYFIQPDGYVSKKTLENKVYQSSSDLYNWLENKDFHVYHDFRSNYSSTLVSNASLFTMKHHYFGETLLPAMEMPRARSILNGDNSVIDILHNNGYQSYFIVEDDYFQQNLTKNSYSYQNIDLKNIPFFSSGQNIKRDVFKDLENVIKRDKNSVNPKFFFIQKLIPHHVHYKESKEIERNDYLNKLDNASIWVKKIINLITEKDPNAIIIVAADHGGWVGIENYKDFYSTNDEFLVNSLFSTLCSIKWNKIDNLKYDKALKTNVNIFRVLFSALSKNSAYLNYLEEDGSYQLRKENKIGMSIYRLIDKNGLVVSEKLEK